MEGFERKLLASILLIMLAFLPVLGFGMYSLSELNASQRALDRVYPKVLLLAQSLKTVKMQQNAWMPLFVISGDQFILDQFDRSNQEFDQAFSDLQSMPLDVGAERMLRDVGAMEQDLRALAQPGVDLKQHGASIDDVNQYFRKTCGLLSIRIITRLDEFVQVTLKAYDVKQADHDKVFHTIFRVLACATVITIAFCLVVVCLIVRLVQKKRAYDQLNERLAKREREISNARKAAVETVAHDLRNPLTAIMMSAEFIRERSGLPSTHRVRTTLETIAVSADAMHRLIKDVLDHAKIEAGVLSLSKANCDIILLLTSVISRFEIMATSKAVTIVNDLAADLPLVLVDKVRMEQVFSNLLGNAVKFTPRGGTIRVFSDIQDNELVISVSDTGPGLRQEQAAFIFERYWQAGETASQGTGLGLAISKAIVEAHSGRIAVQSKPGAGATFSISLPIRRTVAMAM
jgi:signal transduction histidine kinase